MSPTTPLSLDRTSDTPLYRQIEDQLRGAIRARRLPPGGRVPSIRALARQLGVARLTVVTAYEGLTAEGLLVGRVGVGTVVASTSWPDSEPRPSPTAAVGRAAMPSPRPGLPRRPLRDGAPTAGRADLRPGAPAMDLFPRRAWERLVREAWQELMSVDGERPVPGSASAGDGPLREAFARHLAATRATVGGPERVVITSGATASLAAISAMWLGPGQVAVIEEPGRPEVRRTLELSGATVVGVPVDDRGLVPGLLPAEASLLVVSPAWQYPVGGTLPLARRGRLLAWAASAGAVVVEDDRADPIRLIGARPASLQGMEPDGPVIHLAGLDPVLSATIRIGALLVPDGFAERIAAVLESIDPGPSPIEQRALARFIRQGHLARHEGHLRIALAERQSALLEALGQELGRSLSAEPVPAGLHVIAHLDDERWTPGAFVEAAARVGVHVGRPGGVAGGPVEVAPDRRLLLQFAGHTPAELRAAVGLLARAIESDPRCWARDGRRDQLGVPAVRPGRRVAEP